MEKIEIRGQMTLHELKAKLHEIVIWPKKGNRQMSDTKVTVDCWIEVVEVDDGTENRM